MQLTEQQKKQIAEAVQQAERKTSGEIVPMLVRRSDDYPGARWRVAIAFALLVALLFGFFAPGLPSEYYIWAEFPALGLGYLLGSWEGVQRIFLSKAKMMEEVHQRALQAFFYQGLTATRGRTGILIMVSLLERRVEVLADSGISAKVEQNTWDQLVSRLLHEIKYERLTEGMCQAILQCGELLSAEFPRAADDENELKDTLILDS